MFKGILQFIKSKTFFKHLAIYLVIFLVICWGIITWLGSYTSHGKTVSVPDFKGVKLADLDHFVSDKNVGYLVIDSLYDVKSPSGVVVKQEPEANEKVKDSRVIYLYVTSILPPSIQMPKLIDRSLRQASAMIITYGLKLGKPVYVTDQCANCVLDQLVNGKKIEPGTLIAKGTVITLKVGKGLGNEEVGVPCLYGLTRKQAMGKLEQASLNIGAVIPDGGSMKDSLTAKVYKQSPACGNGTSINLGGTVDIYITSDKNKIPAMPDTAAAAKKKDNEDFD